MLSIIIPTKEEPGIQNLVDKINEIIKQPHEIIIVDESKIQPSVTGARLLKQQSSGDIILTMDGDGSHRPEDLPKLLSALSSNDVVLGSRFARGGMTFDVTHRRLVSML